MSGGSGRRAAAGLTALLVATVAAVGTARLETPAARGAPTAIAGPPTEDPPRPIAGLGDGRDRRPAAPPPWMRRLDPGESPPQFVLFSFDGVGSHRHWQRMLAVAARSGAHFTGFLSGTYLLSEDQRTSYQGPGHPPGRASIPFGGTPADVATRVTDLNRALAAGHEIGTHYNGHFCTGAEPSVGTWSTAQWNAELDQFFEFVSRAPGLRLERSEVVGGRTPCLQGRMDQSVPAMRAHGLRYDTSRPSTGIIWPTRIDGIWEFWMPMVPVPALNRRVIMMDYNLWANFNQVRNEPARAEEFAVKALDTYRAAYGAAAGGNRAPLVVGSHFNDWSGGAFTDATERFMAEVCPTPGTVCATYSEVIAWLELQDPAVLAGLRSRPPS